MELNETKTRGIAVRISEGLYESAKAQAAMEFRTIGGQLEYWARVGQHALDHPGLSVTEVLAQMRQHLQREEPATEPSKSEAPGTA